MQSTLNFLLLLLLLLLPSPSHTTAPSPRTRHLQRSIKWNMLETLLPDVNVGIVIGVCVCRLEFLSFSSFCNAISIEMRPGVWLHALFLSDVPLANLKCETSTSKNEGRVGKCTFFMLQRKKRYSHKHRNRTYTYTNTPERSWVKYLYTKWTFRRIMLWRLILYVPCVYMCVHCTVSTPIFLYSVGFHGFVWCGFNAPQRIVCWMFGYVKLPCWFAHIFQKEQRERE